MQAPTGAAHASDEPVRARAAVIVVNYGSHQLIERNLPELGDTADVIVVDNPTGAAERGSIRELCRRRKWALIEMPRNVGFGAAVNVAVRQAPDAVDAVLIVNPDCALDVEAVRALVANCRQDRTALVTPTLASSAGHLDYAGSTVSLQTGEIRGAASTRPYRRMPRLLIGERTPARAEWVPGTCLALSRELFERLGGFDTAYFLYWEDVDLSYRCLAAGGRLVVRRDLVAVHDSGGTQGAQPGRAKSPTYYRYNCRNRLLFAARHLDGRSRLVWALLAPSIGWEILLRGGRRQLVASWRPWWAALRGSVEGLFLLVVRPDPITKIGPGDRR